MEQVTTAIIGNGGREYELGRQLASSDEVSIVYFLDGNAGTDTLPKGENVAIRPNDIDGIVSFVDEKDIGLTVVGPEVPLVAGVADRLREKGLVVFGPNAEAARLEGSKAYATEFMQQYGIPYPPTILTHNPREAIIVTSQRPVNSYVIKADGLAGGKGVVLPQSVHESTQTLVDMFVHRGYDGAGKETVLISDRYHGPEVSAFVISDGERFSVLPFAQDHKRLLNNDQGSNTGGMGAYAPVPPTLLSTSQEQKIHDIAARSIEGMADRGTPYQGVLYIGLMLAEELNGDPVVIEYNARFGDPETQVVLPLLERSGGNIYGLLNSAAEGELDPSTIPQGIGGAALTVCLAAQGYPADPEKGQPIHGLDGQYEGVILHHAATRQNGSSIETSGGRALYVTGIGETLDEAARRAYGTIWPAGPVAFAGMQYRDDIGFRAMA